MSEQTFTSNYAPGRQGNFIRTLTGFIDVKEIESAEKILLYAPPANSKKDEEERNLMLLEGYRELFQTTLNKLRYEKESSRFGIKGVNREIEACEKENVKLREKIDYYESEGILSYIKRKYFSKG